MEDVGGSGGQLADSGGREIQIHYRPVRRYRTIHVSLGSRRQEQVPRVAGWTYWHRQNHPRAEAHLWLAPRRLRDGQCDWVLRTHVGQCHATTRRLEVGPSAEGRVWPAVGQENGYFRRRPEHAAGRGVWRAAADRITKAVYGSRRMVRPSEHVPEAGEHPVHCRHGTAGRRANVRDESISPPLQHHYGDGFRRSNSVEDFLKHHDVAFVRGEHVQHTDSRNASGFGQSDFDDLPTGHCVVVAYAESLALYI
mmetsp:Transcript_4481/g.8047  ORF Transcript_4481/g.8047 Transcript_4481/m.8047 type:complete len:252 (+) Transcript_4481:1288-2043(+)